MWEARCGLRIGQDSARRNDPAPEPPSAFGGPPVLSRDPFFVIGRQAAAGLPDDRPRQGEIRVGCPRCRRAWSCLADDPGRAGARRPPIAFDRLFGPVAHEERPASLRNGKLAVKPQLFQNIMPKSWIGLGAPVTSENGRPLRAGSTASRPW